MVEQEQKTGHTLRVEIEKLDGGYISNITGKRRIYKNALDIDDAIDFKNVLSTIEENEYVLDINLVPKELYKPFLQGEDVLSTTVEEDGMSIKDRAIADGIIQKAEQFNPLPAPVEPDIHAPITVSAKNAYTVSKLKSLPWKDYDDQLPMTVSEKAEIAGLKKQNMYQLWANAVSGKSMFQSADKRIAFTILAMYYERNLNIRSSTKDQLDALKNGLLAQLRDLELLASKGNYTKSSVIGTSIGKMRKLLIQ